MELDFHYTAHHPKMSPVAVWLSLGISANDGCVRREDRPDNGQTRAVRYEVVRVPYCLFAADSILLSVGGYLWRIFNDLLFRPFEI